MLVLDLVLAPATLVRKLRSSLHPGPQPCCGPRRNRHHETSHLPPSSSLSALVTQIPLQHGSFQPVLGPFMEVCLRFLNLWDTSRLRQWNHLASLEGLGAHHQESRMSFGDMVVPLAMATRRAAQVARLAFSLVPRQGCHQCGQRRRRVWRSTSHVSGDC